MWRKLFSSDHVAAAKTLKKIGMILHRQQRYDKALYHYEQEKKILGLFLSSSGYLRKTFPG
jgi:hypothetical protein